MQSASISRKHLKEKLDNLISLKSVKEPHGLSHLRQLQLIASTSTVLRICSLPAQSRRDVLDVAQTPIHTLDVRLRQATSIDMDCLDIRPGFFTPPTWLRGKLIKQHHVELNHFLAPAPSWPGSNIPWDYCSKEPWSGVQVISETLGTRCQTGVQVNREAVEGMVKAEVFQDPTCNLVESLPGINFGT